MSRTHLNAVRIRTEERGYIALYNAEQRTNSLHGQDYSTK